MKIAINRCFGGFELSYEGWKMYVEKKYPNAKIESTIPSFFSEQCRTSEELEYVKNTYATWSVDGESIYSSDINRTDPILIEVIETLGERANGSSAHLKIVEIPDDVKYEISVYNGLEKIEEVHRVWC